MMKRCPPRGHLRAPVVLFRKTNRAVFPGQGFVSMVMVVALFLKLAHLGMWCSLTNLISNHGANTERWQREERRKENKKRN